MQQTTKLGYKVIFIDNYDVYHPDIESNLEGFPSDYLNQNHKQEYLDTIFFLKKYSQLKGEEALLYLNNWVFKEPNGTEVKPFLLRYYPELSFGIQIKGCHDCDNLQIVYDLVSNELLFFDGLLASFEGKITKDNALRKVNLEQWLYLWDWWQEKKVAGLKLETGTVEIPIIASPKYSIFKPLAEYLKKDILNWVENDFWVTEEKTACDFLEQYLRKLEDRLDPKFPKIAELKTLSTRRPLLAREKIEMDFLQKILKANSLADLQSIENEVNSTPTDPELIKRLLHNINEKKGFY